MDRESKYRQRLTRVSIAVSVFSTTGSYAQYQVPMHGDGTHPDRELQMIERLDRDYPSRMFLFNLAQTSISLQPQETKELRSNFSGLDLQHLIVPSRRVKLLEKTCPECLTDAMPDVRLSVKTNKITVGDPDLEGYLPEFSVATIEDQLQTKAWWLGLTTKLKAEHRNSVVRLVYPSKKLCTGVLITADAVLTAGHCVDERPESVAVGDAYVPRVIERVIPDSCELHPHATSLGTDQCGASGSALKDATDLALLRLEHPISPYLAHPVVLLEGMKGLRLGNDEYLGRVVGFGSTDSFDDHKLPEFRQHAPVAVSEESGPEAILRSITRATIAGGDSGGATFVSCSGSASEALIAIHTATTKEVRGVAIGAPVFDTTTLAWLRHSLRSRLTTISLEACLPLKLIGNSPSVRPPSAKDINPCIDIIDSLERLSCLLSK